MFRYLLPVLATLLLGGCCSGYLCGLDVIEQIEHPPEGNPEAASDLWEAERNRTDSASTGEALPDTTEVPDSLSSFSQPDDLRRPRG